jgi:UDP-N-acetylglucosamine 2-epimerase (non-hydrolysing)
MTAVWHVVGTRPNFPKAAPVLTALTARGVSQQLVHTGQHSDDRLSGLFLRELDMRPPDVNLGVGPGSRAEQTAQILLAFDSLLVEAAAAGRSPDLVVVYGDVTSTVASALATTQRHLPLAHVEAGLRSFDRTMPEEDNRRITDAVSTLLFAPSPDAVTNLLHEGIDAGSVYLVGNTMIDSLLAHRNFFDVDTARKRFGLSGPYVVVTLHRPGNVDDEARVAQLVSALHACADQVPLLFPVHPRGRQALEAAGVADHPGIRMLAPLGYTDFHSLARGASAVVTDSGGVQEETTVLGVPCLTIRPNTERPITITEGTNRLATPSSLPVALAEVLRFPPPARSPALWDGHAGERIAEVIADWIPRVR